MSSADRHRGRHPADEVLFGAAAVAGLRVAVGELSWLMGRGYAMKSAVKLVGDRHELRERQRLAVSRAACSDAAREGRARRCLAPEALRGRRVMVDGFNLLVSLEAALSGGVILRCRDGCVRDMSGVHGSYHAVVETDAALALAGERLAELGAERVHWLLDKPVSNSGRLAGRMREVAAERGWPWEVEAVFNPDAELMATQEAVVVSSDAMVIDGAGCWYNLAGDVVMSGRCGEAWVVEMG